MTLRRNVELGLSDDFRFSGEWTRSGLDRVRTRGGQCAGWVLRVSRLMLVAGLTILVAALTATDVAAQTPLAECDDLLEQARAQLEAADFSSMFEVAKEREVRCPGPTSSFLVGLALANLLDQGKVKPKVWQASRDRALGSLRGALGAADLPAGWKDTAGEWIAHLETLPAPPPPKEELPAEQPTQVVEKPFPWGPVVLGSISLALFAGAATVGLAGALKENAMMDKLGEICTKVGGKLKCTQDNIDGKPLQEFFNDGSATVAKYYDWNRILLIAGGVTGVGAIVWFIIAQSGDEPEAPAVPAAWTVTPQVGLGRGAVWGLDIQGRF